MGVGLSKGGNVHLAEAVPAVGAVTVGLGDGGPSTAFQPPVPATWSADLAPAPAAATVITKEPSGSSVMTCFFDPSHGTGTTVVLWSPQWGVSRQVQTCGGCAHRRADTC